MKGNTYTSSARALFLTAAHLVERGFIVTVTIGNAPVADLMVTDRTGKKTYTIQVKGQKGNSNFWLVGKHAENISSPSHVYVLVNLCKDGPRFYIVPSKDVSRGTRKDNQGRFHNFTRDERYRDNWQVFA